MAQWAEYGNFIVRISSNLDRVRPESIQLLIDQAKSCGLDAGFININEELGEIDIDRPDGKLIWHDRIRDIYR